MNSMKVIKVSSFFALLTAIPAAHAQININDRLKQAGQQLVTGFTFSNEDAQNVSRNAVVQLDAKNTIAGPTNAYALRLNRVFGPHKQENGLALNFKVYLTKDVNAFATADGSVRVFQGLMDMMDDNQLLAVIGHEIGHVANEDSRDAAKRAYLQAGLVDAAASQSDKIATATDGDYGKIGQALITSKYSRKQESEADDFSYDFMKKHGYNVNAVESAFLILAKLSGGQESSLISQMMSTHPDPASRADKALARAEADGLYKPYVVQKAAPAKGGKTPKKGKKK
ncbi:MAG: peptidase [Flavobacterium sp. BFFFF2]|nr:MAG: peptidase [Flavobacterium sp. BFFFF2]